MSCTNQIQICAVTHGVCSCVGNESSCPHYNQCPSREKEPTVEEVMRIYREALPERIRRTGQESLATTLSKTERMVSKVLEVNGLTTTSPFSAINRRAMANLAQKLKADGFAAASIKTYLVAIQRVGAVWVQRLFEELGKELRPIPMPDLEKVDGNYHTPPTNRLTALKIWYGSLPTSESKVVHVYAMLMYHFAMRNSDVDLLKWSAITEERGRTVLTYEPHKTRLKSHRKVRVEVCDVDAHYLRDLRGNATADDFVIPGGSGGSHDYIRKRINTAMRGLGFTGSKASYELRKACGDEYARRFGVDTAKAILGHTLVSGSTAHYVDPSSMIVPTIWN